MQKGPVWWCALVGLKTGNCALIGWPLTVLVQRFVPCFRITSSIRMQCQYCGCFNCYRNPTRCTPCGWEAAQWCCIYGNTSMTTYSGCSNPTSMWCWPTWAYRQRWASLCATTGTRMAHTMRSSNTMHDCVYDCALVLELPRSAIQ